MDEVLQLEEGTNGSTRKRCKAINLRGEPCSGWVMKGFEYCYIHNPEVAEERHASQKLGGATNQAKHSPRVNLGNIPRQVRTIDDLLLLLDYCKDEMLFLNNGLNRNKALVQLAGAYSQVLKDANMEDRIDDMYDEVQGLLEKAKKTRKR